MNATENTNDGFIDHSAAHEAQHEAWRGDAADGAENKQSNAERIAGHPMYSASDLAYLRRKGYGDAEILAFWDRDHAAGAKPVHHENAGSGKELQDLLRDCISPQAVALIAQAIRQRLEAPIGEADAVIALQQDIAACHAQRVRRTARGGPRRRRRLQSGPQRHRITNRSHPGGPRRSVGRGL